MCIENALKNSAGGVFRRIYFVNSAHKPVHKKRPLDSNTDFGIVGFCRIICAIHEIRVAATASAAWVWWKCV